MSTGGTSSNAMNDSAQLQSPILNPSQAAITYPAYRRRPIRSRTYQTLLQILSHCPVSSVQGDLGNVETRSADDESGVISHDEVNRKESENNELVQETSNAKSKEVFYYEDGSFLDKRTTALDFGQADDPGKGENVNNLTNKVEIKEYMVIENQSCNNDVEKMKCGDPLPFDDFNAFDGHLKVDEESSIQDFSEVLGSCYMDMADEPSKAGGNDQRNGSTLDEYIAEHELRMKELELENLISNPGAVELTSGPTADNEIEEGEISTEGEISVESLSDISPEKRSTEVAHNSVDHHAKEDITDDETRGHGQQNISDFSLVNMESEGKRNSMVGMRKAPDYNFIYGFHDSHTSTQTGRSLAPSVESSMAAENQIALTTGEDNNSNKKKRKKGPMTEERKAKKKKKERIKRAEKNRQLGVNRLKLQTVLKPKKIAYCRHYLQGRCHEGEKCKFSHDTVPLTKSKPCGYFARNSCLKGDDCPFDHELSKYPCNNYATTGYCSRGSDCLFSHKMPASHSQSLTPNISKTELKSEQQMFHSLVASNFTKPTENLACTRKINLNTCTLSDDNHSNKTDAKSCSVGNTPCKGTEQPAPKTASRPPKGINFLVSERTPLSDTKQKQDASSVMTSYAVDASPEEVLKAHIRSNTSNGKKSENAAPRRPRGINFLTFAQPFSDDSRNKMISNLVSSSSTEPLKLVAGESSQGENTLSSVQVTDGLSKDKSSNDGSGNISVPNMSGEANILTPFCSSSVSWDQLTRGHNAKLLSDLKPSVLSNTPSSVRNAVQSTLGFAEKFDASIKLGSIHRHRG